MDKGFLGFLTPARRQAIYTVVGAAATALLVFGIVTQEQLDLVVQSISAVVAALSSIMAALNTNRS